MSNSGGCGCSQPQKPMTPQQIKATLQSVSVTPTRAQRCYCSKPRRIRSDIQQWCPPKHWIEPFCDHYNNQGPDFDRDGELDEPNYRQQRTRRIVECNGNTYVKCGPWTWTSTCCLTSSAEPDCLDNVRGPGSIIECSEIVTPGTRITPDPGLPDVPPESPRPTPDPRVPPRGR
ncbi:MAG: hypothetical protein KatS3mg016_0771 [Fimbriimonadales bacterium]|nr:MAG: hypothetical protein KatS3mg016_0771 [Fimbriimonadales bacterium]